MRSAGNFHPDWGYLAPAPSFMRTVRIALVATAIGAIAGAVVVVSLIERPGGNDDNTSIASHALVISAPTLTSPAAASANPKSALAPTPASVKTPAVPASARAPVPSSKPTAAGPAGTDKSNAMSATAAPVTPRASVAGTTVVQPAAGAAPASAPAVPAASVSGVVAAQPVPAPVQASSPATPSTSAAGVAGVQSAPAAAPESAPAAGTRDTASERRVASRRRREDYEARRAYVRRHWRDDGGFGPLLHLFSGDNFDSN
jgi:DNA segregation ATPase FtsK/SpoIIIE, S-DNA-T family